MRTLDLLRFKQPLLYLIRFVILPRIVHRLPRTKHQTSRLNSNIVQNVWS